MGKKLLVHAAGIALATVSFVLWPRGISPAVSSGETGRANGAASVSSSNIGVEWPKTVIPANPPPSLRCAQGLLDRQPADTWAPASETLLADPELQRALFLYGIALDVDADCARLNEETPVHRSSARFLGRILLHTGGPAIDAVFARASRETAASWLAGALILLPEDRLEVVLEPLQRREEASRSVFATLLGYQEGLHWLMDHPDVIRLAGKLQQLPAIKADGAVSWSDNGGTITGFQKMLQSDMEESQKCDAIRERILHMPLAKLLRDYPKLIDASSGDPLYLEVCTKAITGKIAYGDFDLAMTIAEEVGSSYQYRSEAVLQDLLRNLIDADQLAASGRISALPPGDLRDALARALIQETRMSTEERQAWIESIQNPEIRAIYEK